MEMQLTVTTREIEHMADILHDAYLKTCPEGGSAVEEVIDCAYSSLPNVVKDYYRASVRTVLKYLGINEVKE